MSPYSRLIAPRFIAFSTAFLCATMLSTAAASAVDFDVRNGAGHSLTEVEIGDDIFVHISNVSPAEEDTYTLSLRHAGHGSIATLDVAVGPAGSHVKLWADTGVSCGPCQDPDPERHLFATFQDAEAHLAGGLLYVDVHNSLDQPVASFSLPVLGIGKKMHTYIGNAYDCPITRNRAAGEDLRLIVRNPSSRLSEIRVFVVNSMEPNSDGSIPLIDVRGTAYMNGQVITPGQRDISEALWIAPPNEECKLCFVVRRSFGGVTDDTPVLRKGDEVIETLDLKTPHGNGTGGNPGTNTPDTFCEIC